MSEYNPIRIGQPDQLIDIFCLFFIIFFFVDDLYSKHFHRTSLGQISFPPYFSGSDICHKSSFCQQSIVTECILNLLDP